jgi:hypothetical protein
MFTLFITNGTIGYTLDDINVAIPMPIGSSSAAIQSEIQNPKFKKNDGGNLKIQIFFLKSLWLPPSPTATPFLLMLHTPLLFALLFPVCLVIGTNIVNYTLAGCLSISCTSFI